MTRFIRPFFILLLFLLLGLQMAIGQNEITGQKAAGSEPLPLDELRAFTEVFARIKSDYVEPVDDRKLLEEAIRGMLAGLDPHSAYLDKDSYDELQEGTTGEFGGLGIEVGTEEGFIKVIAPIDDTPAQKAGIKAGDLIIKLDDTPVKGISLNDAVKRMRGKPGTTIKLTIIRNGEEKPLDFTLTRAVIKVASVRVSTLEPGYGYVRVSNFQANTGPDLRKELDKLKQENSNNLKGIVLDLRNNPGGVLNAAVEVADMFLDKGLIVYTEGRVKDSQLKFNAKPGDNIDDKVPMVLLVNGGSASASEIVAGALQDHKRAVIMGQKTFGKGSVQTILPMSNGTAIKLTTARYFTPSGRSIQASGIVPDITTDVLKLEKAEETAGQVKESDLSGHLENGQLKDQTMDKPITEQDPSLHDQKAEERAPPLSASDYELYEALNVLKGMALTRKTGE
jgi:carboxyl-terminal processing protease